MKVMVVYVSKKKLINTSGKGYREVLNSLLNEGVLESYEDVVKLTFDKTKALHIQAVLEFYETKDVPINPKSSHIKKED